LKDMSTVKSLYRQYSGDLGALLVASMWGTGFVFQKAALGQFNTPTYIALRYIGMLALSWGILLWWCRRTRQSIPSPRRDIAHLTVIGLLGYTFYIPLSTVGLSHTTAFSNALLIATSPVFMILLTRLLRLEPVHPSQYVGLAIALAGISLFVLPALRAGSGPTGLGDIISLSAAVFFGAYSLANKPLIPRYPLVALMAYTLTLGTVPVVLVLLPWISTQEWQRITPLGWAAFAWTVVVPVYVAWTLWNWVIGRLGVTRASPFMYLVPIIGGTTSWILLGESFDLLKIAGAAVTLAGVGFARRPPRPRREESGIPVRSEAAPAVSTCK
jgi:drug/metabolite transporter (DMT)-like permease